MKKMLLALSLSGALLGGSVAWAEEAASVPNTSEVTVVETTSAVLEEAPAVVAASVEEVSAPAEEEVKLDTGDTA